MATDHRTTGLGRDFASAIEDLRATLQQATDATSALHDILPRIDAIAGMFDEIETALRSWRERLGGGTSFGGHSYGFETPRPRPTLVVPAIDAASAPQPHANGSIALAETPLATGTTRTLRIEIESAGGALDLRAVDDAMGRHPDVNDIALLDYDGHRATLKLWVGRGSSAADVQTWLASEGALPEGHAFTVVALDDVA